MWLDARGGVISEAPFSCWKKDQDSWNDSSCWKNRGFAGCSWGSIPDASMALTVIMVMLIYQVRTLKFRRGVDQEPLYGELEPFLPGCENPVQVCPWQSAIGFPSSCCSRKGHVMGRGAFVGQQAPAEQPGVSLRLPWTHSKSFWLKWIYFLSLQSVSSCRLLPHMWNSTENLQNWIEWVP